MYNLNKYHYQVWISFKRPSYQLRKYMYLGCYLPPPSGTSLSYLLRLGQVLLKIKFVSINIIKESKLEEKQSYFKRKLNVIMWRFSVILSCYNVYFLLFQTHNHKTSKNRLANKIIYWGIITYQELRGKISINPE